MLNTIPLHGCTTFCFSIHWLIRHLACFQILAIINDDAMNIYRIFRTTRHTPPLNLGGKWGCVLESECSLHLHWWNIMLFMFLNILPHFLLQNFFPYFPLKPRCVLWSEKYGRYLSWRGYTFSVFLSRTLGSELLGCAKEHWLLLFTGVHLIPTCNVNGNLPSNQNKTKQKPNQQKQLLSLDELWKDNHTIKNKLQPMSDYIGSSWNLLPERNSRNFLTGCERGPNLHRSRTPVRMCN